METIAQKLEVFEIEILENKLQQRMGRELTRSERFYLIVSMRLTFMLICHTILVFAFLATDAAAATHETCTARDAREATSKVGQQKDWGGVYRSFKRFRHCDDGDISEEYSYAIGHLLAHHWDRLADLIRITASDREFAEFVVFHIDENIWEGDAQLIVSNAHSRCPREAKWLCRSIVDY
jgi:hypothetical protein